MPPMCISYASHASMLQVSAPSPLAGPLDGGTALLLQLDRGRGHSHGLDLPRHCAFTAYGGAAIPADLVSNTGVEPLPVLLSPARLVAASPTVMLQCVAPPVRTAGVWALSLADPPSSNAVGLPKPAHACMHILYMLRSALPTRRLPMPWVYRSLHMHACTYCTCCAQPCRPAVFQCRGSTEA